ncbi:MAG: Fur family transcriptional regulator [Ilumatobacteraceae bacterium]
MTAGDDRSRRTAELHRSVAHRLAEQDQQYTANRRTVVDLLAAAGCPVTLPDLLAADPTLAQSSVYRTLSVLTDAGVVHRLVHVGDHAMFELDEHLTGHHHHLVCDRCGTVLDVVFPESVESLLARTFDEVSSPAGFSPTSHTIDVHGRCAACS